MIKEINNHYYMEDKKEKYLEVDIELDTGEKFGVFLESDGNGWKVKQNKNTHIEKEMTEKLNKKVKEIISCETTKEFLRHAKSAENRLEKYCSKDFLKRIEEMEKLYIKSLS